jgi:bifunctional non-homologous end joining protein LigD
MRPKAKKSAERQREMLLPISGGGKQKEKAPAPRPAKQSELMARTPLKQAAAAARLNPVSEYPGYIEPALAKNVGRPPAGENWVHEIKFDGFRTQLHLRRGKVTAYSTGEHDWTDRYAKVVEHAAQLDAEHAVVDGEMVVLREDGACDFWALQKDVRAGNSDRLSFYAFDLLFCDGDLRRCPFVERKQALRELIATGLEGRLLYSEHTEVEIDGPTMWQHAHKINEGIVSKRIDSPYRSARGEDWIKTPCQYREALLVAGIAYDGDDFGGLYLARRRAGKLIYAGKVVDGFPDEAVAPLLSRLKPLLVGKQSVPTTTPKPDAKWVEPTLEVRIVHRGGLTADRVRRAVFEGLVEERAPKSKLQAPPQSTGVRRRTSSDCSLMRSCQLPVSCTHTGAIMDARRLSTSAIGR